MSGNWCPIGPLNLHTMNYERTECIWCGPGRLASKPGRWLPIENGQAWSAAAPRPDVESPREDRRGAGMSEQQIRAAAVLEAIHR